MFADKIEKYRHGKGIGLLELMLALAIISILIIMATRYYQTASRSQKVAEAVTQVNAIIAAVGKWKIGKIESDYVGGLSIQQLVDQGLLPNEFKDGAHVNPWGGHIIITPLFRNRPHDLTIQFNEVDSKDGAALESMFGGTAGTSNITVTCTGNICQFLYKNAQS